MLLLRFNYYTDKSKLHFLFTLTKIDQHNLAQYTDSKNNVKQACSALSYILPTFTVQEGLRRKAHQLKTII